MDFSRHLLIDAHNVIHHWPEMRRVFYRNANVARDRLAAAVRILHDRECLRLTLVFDGKGSEIAVERPGEHLTFSFLYSPSSMTADDVIERMVGSSKNPGGCTVVTRDLAERQTVEALGGNVISPDELRDWVDRVERSVRRELEIRRRSVEIEWKKNLGAQL